MLCFELEVQMVTLTHPRGTTGDWKATAIATEGFTVRLTLTSRLCSADALFARFNLQLMWITRDYFWHASVLGDLSRDANPFSSVVLLRSAKLAAIASPDRNREDLARIRFIQIDERWLALC